jgi:hypothetical protein
MAATSPSRPRPQVAAGQAAWSRSARVISAHLAGTIISVVAVTAPDRYAAAAAARAVISAALNRRALSFSQPADDRTHDRADAGSTPCA